ncbi:MAG: hypothetical protein Kow00114_10350 [Kiloniellaceae bacterium]
MCTSLSLSKVALAGALAAALSAGAVLPALAGEASAEMHRVRDSGPGPSIGKVLLADTPDGVSLKLDLTELPPGPNRLFLQASADCSAPQGAALESPLAVVNVGITEGGADPLKTTLMVPGMTLEDMANRALIVYRGSRSTDSDPAATGQPRLVACGVIQ